MLSQASTFNVTQHKPLATTTKQPKTGQHVQEPLLQNLRYDWLFSIGATYDKEGVLLATDAFGG
jgi:hypothetical protein